MKEPSEVEDAEVIPERKMILFYDTETTGLPIWNKPSELPSQPHLVQLAAVLADSETEEVIQSIDLIIKPETWDIPEAVTAIHGISTQHALDHGVDEGMAVIMLHLLRGNSQRVSFNKVFDARIIRIAMKRYMQDVAVELWEDKTSHCCAMLIYQKMYGGKRKKLMDVYKELFEEEFKNAHTAMADTLACMKVYFELRRREGFETK